jgi:predicted signal transduction protein with EAL and GGDEF domain
MPAHLLEIAVDTGALLDEFGSAPDNLQVISEIGVRTALGGWNGGPRELALLERSPARSVILADPFESNDNPAVRHAVESLLGSLAEIGAVASVDGVRSEEHAAWLAEIGVHTARGPLFGGPADLEEILAGTAGRAAASEEAR